MPLIVHTHLYGLLYATYLPGALSHAVIVDPIELVMHARAKSTQGTRQNICSRSV